MVGMGTIVNAAAIVAGGLLGSLVVPRVPDHVRESIMQALGLGVILIGLQMAQGTQELLLVLLSLAIGAAAGEVGRLDDRLQAVAARLARFAGHGRSGFAEAFVNTTLLFCVGAMAITGALQDGLGGNPDTLYAKAVLDGTSAVVFASTMGPGVVLSAIPVLLYQGAITLGAGLLSRVLTPDMIREIGAVGGLLVLGLGLNMTGAARLRVANILPAMFVVPVLLAVRRLALDF
ncbi:DUF554 domain-containing protein [Caldinitratiruptor microaerophilus]|uniref:Membrane protein n=1 Tax=Caldinitratiruptor microaerophilus TaxID=671077 RepID=A0AA35G9V1_9FIRM|nr:DUF554 domain-containing protein [Caldinitratiruptor microaerophilus]BDG61863.1 membrane protein [Caldinitratiruptor microaerophilus]